MASIAELGVRPVVDDKASGPLNAISAAADKAGSSVEAMDTRVGRTNRTFQDLAARIEPVERGTAAIERATRGLNTAMEQAEAKARAEGIAQDRLTAVITAGAQAKEQAALRAVRSLTAEQQAAALTRAGYAQLAGQVQASAAAHANFTAANDNVARSGVNLRGVLGQAGYQVQDFATQVSMGGSALQAFGVQGAQLAGIFGPTGALLGAGLLIGTITAQLLLGRSAADEFADAMKRQSDALKTATDDAARWRDGLGNEAKQVRELTEYYNQLSAARMSQEQRQLAADRENLTQQGNRLRGDATGSMTGVIRELQSQIAAQQVARSQLGASLADRPAYLLSDDDIARLRNGAAIIGQFAERGDVSREALAQMSAALQSVGEGSAAVAQLLQRPLAAIDALTPKARDLEVAQEQLAVRARALGQEMHGAADEATRLNRALADLTKYEGATLGDLDRQISQLQSELGAASVGAERLAQVRASNRRDDTYRREMEDERKKIEELGITGQTAATRLEEFGQQLSQRLDRQGALQDDLRKLEEGLRRTGGAARDASAGFGELRRSASGILVANSGDELAIRSIMTATNNSPLDPDRLKQGRDLASRLLQDARTDTEKYAQTVAQLTDALNSGAISQDTFNQALAAANPAVKQAQQAANTFESTFTAATGRAFEASGNQAENFWDSLLKGAKSTAAQIASQLIFRMAIIPTVNAGASALGYSGSLLGMPNTSIGGLSFGGIFGGGGAGGATQPVTDASGNIIGQVGNASSAQTVLGGFRGINPGAMMSGAYNWNTGFSGVDSVLNTPLWGATGAEATNAALAQMGAGVYGPAAPGAVSGAAGQTVGSLGAGALGVAGGLYGAYSGIQRGGVGGYTQAAGGAATAGLSAAALAGLSVPIYGWVAAAVLSVIGALLPGQKPSGKGQETAIDFGSGESNWRGLTGDRYSAGNREQSEAAAQSIVSLANQLGDALGGIRLQGSAAVGVTQSQLYLRVGEQRDTFGNNEDGAKALADKAAEFLLNEFRKSVSGDFVGILNASPTVEKLQENLTWYDQVYKKFGQSAEAASAYQQALDQVTLSFQGNIDKANELSLSTDAMTAAREKELAKVTAARDLNVRAFDVSQAIRSAQATGAYDLGSQLTAFDMSADQQRAQFREQLEQWGLAAGDVASRMAQNEAILGEERLKLQTDYNAQALAAAQQAAEEQARLVDQARQSATSVIASLADYARGLAYSDKSALSVQDQYGLALSQYNAVSGAAMAGDAGSLSKLQEYSETVLGAGRAMYGSGAEYAALFDRVTGTLGSVGNLSADTLTASFYAQITMDAHRESTQAVVAELRALRSEVASLRTAQTLTVNTPPRAQAA